MLLRHSLGLDDEATAVEKAIRAAIAGGARTADIVAEGDIAVSTTEMTDRIVAGLT